jgi:flagellar hook-associated protein 3 FlgL
MGTANSEVRFAIAAKDGSPVSVYDVSGDAADKFLNIDNAVVGEEMSAGTLNPSFVQGDVLRIDIAGYSHDIDLYAMQEALGGSATPQDVADLINARFQDYDLRAEFNVTDNTAGAEQGRLVVYSPRGYDFTLSGANVSTGTSAAKPGVTDALWGTGTALSPDNRAGNPDRGAVYTQSTTIRTAANQEKSDFFGVMSNLSQTIRAENVTALSNFLLPQIEAFIDNLLKVRATEGALVKRYENDVTRYKQNETFLTEAHDRISVPNLDEAATQYAMMTAVYQASLAMIAQVIQPTLIDFLF